MKFKFNRRKLTFRRFTYYLLSGTIVISCITNGIFAKFTTEDYGGDGARVADFGVVVNISGDLFSTAYSVNTATDIKDEDTTLLEASDSNKPTIITAEDKTISVKAAANADGSHDNVVAPGTKNDVGIDVSVTGTPETDYKLGHILIFKTIYLSGGSVGKGTSYGLMVPFEKGIVNESNFGELVKNELLYKSVNKTDKNSGKTYQEYTKVLEGESFVGEVDYYKLKDEVTVPCNNSYMPIKYYVNTKTKTETETIISHNLLNPSYKCNSDFIQNILLKNFVTHTFVNGDSYAISYEGYAFGDVTFESNAEINKNFSITWEWPYHQEENPTTEEAKKELAWCNACDTILGYIAANKNIVKAEVKENGTTGDYTNNLVNGQLESFKNDYNLDISFDYSITVNQVD